MGDRTYPYDAGSICRLCLQDGAYDVYGDYICEYCLERYIESDKDEQCEDEQC